MIFKFNSHILDAERRTLVRDGEAVVLTPKVFQTLLTLVENHDRVMSKDELYRLIWPDQFVEDANLTQNISVLRRSLDGAKAHKTHIVTFHGHGYRFVEPVVEEPFPNLSHSAPASPVRLELASVLPEVASAVTLRRADFSERKWKFLALAAGAVLLIAGAALAIKSRSMRQDAPAALSVLPLPSNVEALTRLQGEQFEPAWSPDGSAFAYINRDGGATQSTIYVQRNGEMRPRLIASGEGLYNSSTWSPDGRSLALIHATADQQEIVIFDLEHGTQRRLAKLFPHRYGLDYRHLDWSPDGTLLAVDDKETETDPLSLYLVHLADGAKSRLTYSGMDIIGDVSPRFSPDGSTIAFIRIKYQGQNAIFRVPVTGSEAESIIDPTMLVSDVDWEANDRILFAARLDDKFRFWRMPIGGATRKPSLASQIGADTAIQFSLKRQTGEIAFSAYSSNLNIWAADIRNFTQWRPVIMSPGQDVAPAYSPDGTRIAFRSDFGGRERLWVSGVDSSNAHAVDTGTIIPAVHAWDADNQTLLFKDRHGTGLSSVNVAGTGPVQQVSSLSVSHPARSVDGKTIFARTGHFIFQIHRDDGRSDKLTAHGGAPIVQSKDGRYLYFAQGRMETSIARFDLQTSQQETIVSSLIPGYNESWALTETGIYYLSEKGGKPVISFHSFANSTERVITAFPGDLPPVGDSGFAASPDGNTLLVVRADTVASNIQDTFVIPVPITPPPLR